MGINAITRKLRDKNIPTKFGKTWHESVVRNILVNEKYTGNLLLQKSFIWDHITKKKIKNNGELPMYYVNNNHEAIIDIDTFNKVQEEIKQKSIKYKNHKNSKIYSFTKKIKCELCGKNYQRKIYAKGTKYEKIIWICSSFNNYGKKYCQSSRIPEEIIKKLSAEVLKISKFDEKIFKKKIKQITVPEKGKLRFLFNDGERIEKTWEYPSRKESWTEEMKKLAKNKCSLRRRRKDYSFNFSNQEKIK